MRKRRTHRLRNGIGSIILMILLVAAAWNTVQYYKLKQTAERFLKSTERIHVEEPVDIVGLLDSYGVPYSPSVEKSFMGYLEEDLESQGMLSSSLDLFGLYINKTWEVDGIFQNDVTIGEMKTMQNFGMDFVRHKYGKERIREDLVYTCNHELEDVTVASYYSDLEHPVVFYSCAANDLFYYFGTSLESLSLTKAIRIIRNFSNGLSLLKKEIKSNLETLTAYNPKAVILVMGLYVPSDNIFLQRAGSAVIDRINGIIADACEEYANAVYVDVTCLSFAVLEGDFHPDEKGQEIIYQILKEKFSFFSFRNIETPSAEVLKPIYEEAEEDRGFIDPVNVEWVEWSKGLENAHYDYVEWAVIFERFLYKRGLESIPYEKLIDLKERYFSNALQELYEGIEILAIERKIHKGIYIEEGTINNGKIDKLIVEGFIHEIDQDMN